MRPAKIVSVIVGIMLISLIALAFLVLPPMLKAEAKPISMAVEFNDHSAAAWIALDKGWFKEEGLNVTTLETFTTGLELATALTKGDVDVAWACLGPLVLTYARGVPIVIVAQAHLHGYAIVGRPGIESIDQLNGGVVACPGKGSPCYLVLMMTIDKYKLNVTIMKMKPSAMLNALMTGQIDAAAMPEHYATLAVRHGNCTVLVRSQDLWPDMPGSFLVVKKDLLEKDPEVIARLIRVTVKATNFIREHPQEAASIVANRLGISFEDALESMKWLDYCNEINITQIEKYIDLMVKYGALEKPINVSDFVDTTILSSALGGQA